MSGSSLRSVRTRRWSPSPETSARVRLRGRTVRLELRSEWASSHLEMFSSLKTEIGFLGNARYSATHLAWFWRQASTHGAKFERVRVQAIRVRLYRSSYIQTKAKCDTFGLLIRLLVKVLKI